MKAIEDQIKDRFTDRYKDAFTKAGNSFSVGFGQDKKSLEVRLTNDTLANTLPTVYFGMKINVVIIGAIAPQS